jgi:hypothetical protein
VPYPSRKLPKIQSWLGSKTPKFRCVFFFRPVFRWLNSAGELPGCPLPLGLLRCRCLWSHCRSKFRPAAVHAHTQPGRSAEGARSLLPVPWGRESLPKKRRTTELGRRNKRHGAPGGTGHLVACPLVGGASSWLGWVTARRPRGRT